MTACPAPWRDRLRSRLLAARADVRRGLDRVDNEEVRQARSLARRLRAGLVDVLHLGNSTVEWIDPDDVDRRPLHRMIADELVGYFAVHGGSYSFELHQAYLDFAMRVGRPQAIIVPLWYRGRFRPWMSHPVYSRRRAAAAIAAMPADTPLWRIRRSFTPPTAEQWRAYAEQPFDTFAGLPTIGDHTRRLKDPAFFDDEQDRAKLYYAYHLSHRIEADLPELGAVERLGAALRATGLPIIVYQNPISVEPGVGHWGEPFREVAHANFAILEEHFRRGFGSDVEVLDTGATFPPEEFLDPGVADEHLNERGRRRLTDRLVAALAGHRPDLVRSERLKP